MSATAAPLTNTSTRIDIYTHCTSYSQLLNHNSLTSVKNLLRCINAYNNTHRIHNTSTAFQQHRSLTLEGKIHKRAHLFVKHSSSSTSSSSSSSSSTALKDHEHIRRLERALTLKQNDYEDMLVRRVANTVKASQLSRALAQEWLEIAVIVLNRRQNAVRFIGPTGAGECYAAQPDRDVVARLMQVRDSNKQSLHWVCALWRSHTSVVNILDSGNDTRDMVRECDTVVKFVEYCEMYKVGSEPMQVDFAGVAKQEDVVSCGLFAVAFCRVLATNGGATDDGKLLNVHIKEVRDWLTALVRWLRSASNVGCPSDDVLSNTRRRRMNKRVRDSKASEEVID